VPRGVMIPPRHQYSTVPLWNERWRYKGNGWNGRMDKSKAETFDTLCSHRQDVPGTHDVRGKNDCVAKAERSVLSQLRIRRRADPSGARRGYWRASHKNTCKFRITPGSESQCDELKPEKVPRQERKDDLPA